MRQRIRQTEQWTRGLNAGIDEGENKLPSTAPPPSPTPIWGTNYASLAPNTDNYGFWGGEQVAVSTRIMYPNDPLGQRGVIQRVECYPTDTNVVGSGSGQRAEVASGGIGFDQGGTYIVSWSTLFPADFYSSDGAWNFFTQIHASGGGNQATHAMIARNSNDLYCRLYGGGVWVNGSQPTGSVSVTRSLGSLLKGQWCDYVMHIRFGSGTSGEGLGFCRIWRNNTLIMDEQNVRIGYYGDPGPYWKQGFYRGSGSAVSRLYFDDTSRWASTTDAFNHYGW